MDKSIILESAGVKFPGTLRDAAIGIPSPLRDEKPLAQATILLGADARPLDPKGTKKLTRFRGMVSFYVNEDGTISNPRLSNLEQAPPDERAGRWHEYKDVPADAWKWNRFSGFAGKVGQAMRDFPAGYAGDVLPALIERLTAFIERKRYAIAGNEKRIPEFLAKAADASLPDYDRDYASKQVAALGQENARLLSLIELANKVIAMWSDKLAKLAQEHGLPGAADRVAEREKALAEMAAAAEERNKRAAEDAERAKLAAERKAEADRIARARAAWDVILRDRAAEMFALMSRLRDPSDTGAVLAAREMVRAIEAKRPEGA